MVVNSSRAFSLEKYITSLENSNKKMLKILKMLAISELWCWIFFLCFDLFSNPANQFWSKHINLSSIQSWKNDRIYGIILMVYSITCYSKNFILKINIFLEKQFLELLRPVTMEICTQQGSEWRIKPRHGKVSLFLSVTL